MSKVVTVLDDQNIFDVASQEYGSVEYVEKLLDDNNLSFDSTLFSGKKLTIDTDFVLKQLPREQRDFIASQGILIVTDQVRDTEGFTAPLTARILTLTNENVGGDGHIGIEVKNGLKPYTYEWKDGAMVVISIKKNLNNASAGTYSFKVTDSLAAVVTFSATIAVGDNRVYLTDGFGEFILDEFGQPILAP